MTTSATSRRSVGGGYVPPGTVTLAYRRRIYLWMISGTLLFLNPLVLYRFEGVAQHLYLQHWFGFADMWQHNHVGASVSELIVWILASLPRTDWDPAVKWMVGLALSAGCVWYL